MGQTSRFYDGIHEELAELEESRKSILEMLMKMRQDGIDVESATEQFSYLCGQASELCKLVWLDLEPERMKESELLIKIDQHISKILLCEWQKWLYKKPDETVSNPTNA